MSLHGTEGRTELRDQIVSAYGVLLDAHPHMMEYIVKDLIAWKRPELTQRISKHARVGRIGNPSCGDNAVSLGPTHLQDGLSQ